MSFGEKIDCNNSFVKQKKCLKVQLQIHIIDINLQSGRWNNIEFHQSLC